MELALSSGTISSEALKRIYCSSPRRCLAWVGFLQRVREKCHAKAIALFGMIDQVACEQLGHDGVIDALLWRAHVVTTIVGYGLIGSFGYEPQAKGSAPRIAISSSRQSALSLQCLR